MENKFEDIVNSSGVLFAFSNTAMVLQKEERFGSICPEEYNLTLPDIVTNIYKEHLNETIDIIGTNTLRANRQRLKHFNLEKKVKEINHAAVSIVKEVTTEGKIIAGIIGSLGKTIKPLGNISEIEAYETFAEQSIALEEAGVDFLSIKNITAVDELTIAVIAAKENTSVPISASIRIAEKDNKTYWGTDINSVIEMLSTLNTDIIGFHSKNLHQMEIILNEVNKSKCKLIQIHLDNDFESGYDINLLKGLNNTGLKILELKSGAKSLSPKNSLKLSQNFYI